MTVAMTTYLGRYLPWLSLKLPPWSTSLDSCPMKVSEAWGSQLTTSKLTGSIGKEADWSADLLAYYAVRQLM